MLKTNIFGYILIAFVIIISIKMYRESDMFQLKCIISDVDGKQYCVRERAKLELAADLLANTTKNMQLLVDNVNEKYPDRDNVRRLMKNFNPKKVKEVIAFVRQSGGLEYAEEQMLSYQNKAINTIASLPNTQAKTSLLALIKYVIERKK